MRRTAGFVLITLTTVIGLWACQSKSPTEPTPPPATCTFTLSTTSLSFTAAAGVASFSVSAPSHCAWTAASDRGWMTIGEGASGTGDGKVTVTVTANANTDVRTGTLTVAGQAIAVRQDAAASEPCRVGLSSGSASFTKDAATGTFDVTAPGTCSWTAASTAGWLTITSGATGRGNGTVAYSVTRNTDRDSRTGTIRVAEATFTVSQAGDSGLCEFRVAPVAINVCMSVPYDLITTVTTQPGCTSVSTSDTPWIAINGAAVLTGSGDVHFRVGDNYGPPRLGVLKVRWDTPTAGQNVQVSQAGCRYAVSQASIAVIATGGSANFDVYQQSDPLECGGPLQNGCVWSAATTADWITITTSMPRRGDDRVSFTVAPNGGSARTATITVRDQTVVVTQSGR
jgi:hypothetical protein